jgi:hypothetical protein
MLGAAGNGAVQRMVSVQRDPVRGGLQLRLPELGESAGWHHPPDDQYRLHLDPWVEAYSRAMQMLATEIAPETVSGAFAQLTLPTVPPELVQPNPLDARTPPATPAAQPLPPVPGTEARAPGDIWRAIRLDPTVGPLLQRLQSDATSHVHRDWVSMSTGDQVLVVTTGILIGGTALGGVLSSPEARTWAIARFNGQLLPVPGVPGLRLQMNFTDAEMLFGLHFDVGRYLPGFAPSDPRSLRQLPDVPPVQRTVIGTDEPGAPPAPISVQ